MSISPPSDIVFDVAKAADPQAYRAAAAKLARASGTDGAAADFASAAAAVEAAAPQQAGSTSTAAAEVSASNPASPQGAQLAKKNADAYTQFEAFFLQNFVESMLPKDSKALFGSGVAGDIWRSMLAEHMANELAKSASFGIAKQIAENRAMKEKAKEDALHPAKSSATHPAKSSAAIQPAAKDPASGYVASLHKLLAADGRLAISQASPADALASTTKGL